MTYCLAAKIDDGLVFCSDSRTNAGPDQVSTYGKMHRFKEFEDRSVVLLSAGNLATTQAVLTAIDRDIKGGSEENIGGFQYFSEIAEYIGRLSVDTQQKYAAAGETAGFTASASFIVGGQIRGEEPQIYMIYPEGNFITASNTRPYLQIGETKYGKPVLERIIRPETSAENALRCALVSMDSTIHSNATVGPPVELLFYRNDQLNTETGYYYFKEGDPYLTALSRAWGEKIAGAFETLPPLSIDQQ